MAAMPPYMPAVIGMPTICQWVMRPMRNIGAWAKTPATTAAQPVQKAIGWWNDRPLAFMRHPEAARRGEAAAYGAPATGAQRPMRAHYAGWVGRRWRGV